MPLRTVYITKEQEEKLNLDGEVIIYYPGNMQIKIDSARFVVGSSNPLFKRHDRIRLVRW